MAELNPDFAAEEAADIDQDNPVLNGLADQLADKYTRTKVISDLEDAIQACRESIDTTSSHAERAKYLDKLANQLELNSIYSVTRLAPDLEAAIPASRESINLTPANHAHRARKLLDSCSSSDWQQAYEDLTVALPLISQLTSLSLQSADKQHTLGGIARLATDAAAVAISAGKGPLAALTFLEQGRGVLNASLEDLRTDILSLQQKHPTLQPIFESMSIDHVQPERHKSHVLTHLRNYSVFHFAGHGYTDPDDPLKSHLCLDDWERDPLTVADLLDLNLYQKPPFLAYLSACGTGQMRVVKYLDEAIHLASSCQQAGFRHVIGTLWDVDDEFCVDMASMTYEEMGRGRLTDESVCLGLHKACRQLRDRSLGGEARQLGNHLGKLERVESESEDEISARGGTEQGQKELSRKVIVVDNGDDPAASHWVPYVHFGV